MENESRCYMVLHAPRGRRVLTTAAHPRLGTFTIAISFGKVRLCRARSFTPRYLTQNNP